MKRKGTIWPEYWIDCAACDHHEPLAERTLSAAITAACKAGWVRVYKQWYCRGCQANPKRAA
jgi:hypothetical protein